MAPTREESHLDLIDIYQPELNPDRLAFLYKLLEERSPEVSISHQTMPTWGEHLAFVEGRPYKEWWLVGVDGNWGGSAYLSRQNEIGIFLRLPYQGRGFGPRVIDMIIERYGDQDLFANIAPTNYRSERMFMDRNFNILQKTFVRRASD